MNTYINNTIQKPKWICGNWIIWVESVLLLGSKYGWVPNFPTKFKKKISVGSRKIISSPPLNLFSFLSCCTCSHFHHINFDQPKEKKKGVFAKQKNIKINFVILFIWLIIQTQTILQQQIFSILFLSFSLSLSLSLSPD